MAETYTTNVERLAARYKARGIPADRALNMAEKRASAMAKKAHPGEKLGKRHTFKRGTDPVPPKQKKPRKMRQEDIKKYAENMVMEIHGITGLIGGPTGPITGAGSGTGSVGSEGPSSKSSPLSAKYRQDTPDDPTKKPGSGKGASGFKASGGLKASIPKTPEGRVTKGVDTFQKKKMEDIEKEFGIK